jgi:hypothetical protein
MIRLDDCPHHRAESEVVARFARMGTPSAAVFHPMIFAEEVYRQLMYTMSLTGSHQRQRRQFTAWRRAT